MKENNKIWKIIGILFIAYLVIWLWPIVFHRAFFSGPEYVPVSISARPPMDAPFPVPAATEPAYGFRYSGGYEKPVPVPAPAVEAPYNPSTPDAIAPSPSTDESGNQMVACTMEAKQCPDGSYVGRQGPKCEFAPCPGI